MFSVVSLFFLTAQASCLVPFLSRRAEQTDETGGAFGVAGQFREELFSSEPGRQVGRLQIGGDERERVVVWGAAGRAWSLIGPGAGAALASDVFFRWFAHFAFGEASY